MLYAGCNHLPATGACFPAGALRDRLDKAVETPSWTVYLPSKLSRDSWTRRQGHAAVPAAAWSAAGRRGAARAVESREDGNVGESHNGNTASEPRREHRRHRQQQEEQQHSLPLEEGSNDPASAMIGNVWKYARDPQGCRFVQQVLEEASNEGERAAIAAELKGHVWEALRCPHGNFVVQKIITTMPAQASQYIIDELMRKGPGAGSQAAKHRFGCRIIERLLEKSTQEQVHDLVEDIIAESIVLSTHPYGNYVMQHVLEHGSLEQRGSITKLLADNASAVGKDGYACAVAAKALSHSQDKDKQMLALAMYDVPGLLESMARTRHGHIATKLVYQELPDQQRDALRRELTADSGGLRSSRYGRIVVDLVESSEAAKP
mmetsp:Transcript_33274/g.72620  ORF Transcript_33274/g.72620 Transcript_33274/m.72620 type:complete len:377 (+) Transcript_33274:85-1215(+)|eukprot:CAMPEP_0170620340 /NCGR_PEP_ID=MMETSP0224-20130122/28006_1 /TAXON_ID=285029 /ORGANISM="Togula jolla, Strain CCCM 725" /LENGTH=376 /DNA_ID=CAMNT_0010946507 /DNA_START=60 /DNA_END=1190 /DNA_ORIENTATION=-